MIATDTVHSRPARLFVAILLIAFAILMAPIAIALAVANAQRTGALR